MTKLSTEPQEPVAFLHVAAAVEKVDDRELEIADTLSGRQRQDRAIPAEGNDVDAGELLDHLLIDHDEELPIRHADQLWAVLNRDRAPGAAFPVLFEERDNRPGQIAVDLLQAGRHVIGQRESDQMAGSVELGRTTTLQLGWFHEITSELTGYHAANLPLKEGNASSALTLMP